MAEFTRDIFEPELRFVMEESAEVDGVHILGKVKGQFFVPNGVSRNKRYYSEGLWEKTLATESVKDRLASNRMFGTISHEQKLDDTALLEGKVSHYVTSLSIADGKGIGEALILNTPAGKILNTVLRAGCKLFVSSRADGDYKGTFQGVPAVDPDKYKLETFDFVMEPGFLQANPRLVENLQDDFNYLFKETFVAEPVSVDENILPIADKNKKEDYRMDKLVEALTTDKVKLTEQLSQVLGAHEVLKSENVSTLAENATLKEKIGTLEVDAVKMAMYERLGTAERIEESIDTATKQLAQYKALGEVEDVEAVFTVAETLKAAAAAILEDMGSPEEIKQAFAVSEARLEAFKAFGSPEDLEAAFNIAEKTIAEYQAIGTIEQINAILEKTNAIAESMEAQAAGSDIIALAKELGQSEAAIRKVYSTMTEEAIREFFTLIGAPTKKTDEGIEKFRLPVDDTDSLKKPVEGAETVLDKSRGSRLLEQFTR